MSKAPAGRWRYKKRAECAVPPVNQTERSQEPQPLQKGKTQSVRHPQRRSAARLKSGVRRKIEPPPILNEIISFADAYSILGIADKEFLRRPQ